MKIILLMTWFILSGCEALNSQPAQYQPTDFPVLNAVGYAPIEKQPAEMRSEQILMAMEASKILAYRELAEQVYGLQLNSQTAIQGHSLNNIATKIKVSGVIKGAKVVKTYPIDGFYVTELELDFKLVRDLYMQSENPVHTSTLVVEPVKNF
ncbi:flagellar biosynthesis protein FlgP [Shewanella sp. 1_MG-2023]|uniref:LPP20 family lipoprotein n=1 Tax=unclassified Shewanella TaxID=196818 RepID=UPI0026E11527|nr:MULTISPECIES: flagellar biosynthesis protein FlgP [unclassified Shewanella]MDO6613101.1 flagellar biosynthesis protein FlgP [Shewanella sp. 7_MG-2023]MDO6772969.1 flagellar biosynthesis protein FlgP [Shewanella sp. 2_MG-2023]MDO6795691.1 flagellar biosynthesis protein FlgP [Shewanella sp. 1_MG-2023]